MPDYWLEEIIVVADRTRGLLREAPWATSVLSRTTLQQLPARNLVEALRYIPGLTFVDKDGAGHLPMAIVRGFFGGGETEYILLTVDGIPANDLRTGLAEWSQIPLASIERIEVLRGGGSAVYGDAALGAVINVVTRRLGLEQAISTTFSAGQQGEHQSNLIYQTQLDPHHIDLNATIEGADGFRSHARSSTRYLAGKYSWGPKSSGLLHLKGSFQRLKNDDPGPLTPDQIAANRKQNHALFDRDSRVRDRLEASAGFRRNFTPTNHLSSDFGIHRIHQEQTRTLLLSPNLGDTQFHDEQSLSLWSRTQYTHRTRAASIITGIDAEHGTYKSRYFAPRDKTQPLSAGEGHRTRAGLYLETKRTFADRWHAAAGLRYDWIRNTHQNAANPEANPSLSQWTPRLGINYAYLSGETNPGHLYVNWTRAFKAPTLDQLFDRRQIPTGAPGQTLNLSNARLRPQTANGFETGIYQRIPFVKHRLYAELTLSAYRIDLKDEIDFDLSTFKYGNIQKSRHDGLEGSATLYVLPRLSVNSALNLTEVTFRSGEQSGNKLKNIPGKSTSTSLTFYLPHNLQATVAHRYTGRVFLDDTNHQTLPAYQTFDGKLQWSQKSLRLHLTAMNLANSLHNSSGFVLFDPTTFQNIPFFYPARGRYYQARVEFQF